MKFHH